MSDGFVEIIVPGGRRVRGRFAVVLDDGTEFELESLAEITGFGESRQTFITVEDTSEPEGT